MGQVKIYCFIEKEKEKVRKYNLFLRFFIPETYT